MNIAMLLKRFLWKNFLIKEKYAMNKELNTKVLWYKAKYREFLFIFHVFPMDYQL